MHQSTDGADYGRGAAPALGGRRRVGGVDRELRLLSNARASAFDGAGLGWAVVLTPGGSDRGACPTGGTPLVGFAGIVPMAICTRRSTARRTSAA